jgi:hypothetical protein
VTHVYATLRKLDAFLDGFASNFKRDLVEKVVMDPWTAAVAALKDVAGTYETTADLITRLIDGHPIDIYHRGKSSKRRTLPRRQGKLAPGGRKDPG